MSYQAYKVFTTHAHEILWRKIISILLLARDPNLGDTNGDVQSDLSSLAFNNRWQLEDFHRRIIRLQQEINLPGETDSPTRLLLQHMKVLSKKNEFTAFLATKMTYLNIFLDRNGKPSIYAGKNLWTIWLSINNWRPN